MVFETVYVFPYYASLCCTYIPQNINAMPKPYSGSLEVHLCRPFWTKTQDWRGQDLNIQHV